MLVKIEWKQNQNEKLKISKAQLKCEGDEVFEEKGFECRNGTNCSMQYMKKKKKKTKTKKRQTNKHAQGYYNMNTEQMVALSCLIGVGIWGEKWEEES